MRIAFANFAVAFATEYASRSRRVYARSSVGGIGGIGGIGDGGRQHHRITAQRLIVSPTYGEYKVPLAIDQRSNVQH